MEQEQLHQFVSDLSARLGKKNVRLEAEFPWFYERKGPSSELSGLNHATVKMTVQLDRNYKISGELLCAVTTLCSKEISEYSAHNQRGIIKISIDAEVLREDWKEQLLHAAESNASACIHPLLKRPDEKTENGIKKFDHDQNGNMTLNGDFTFDYNAENKLTAITKTDGTAVSSDLVH